MRISFSLIVSCCLLSTAVYAQNNKGIGIGFNRVETTAIDTVVSVTIGNAAAEAGLRVGDELLEIDGVELSKLDRQAVIALLKGGATGAAYHLKIRRKIQTTLGERKKEMELLITPREVTTSICISGDCKNGNGIYLDNTSGIRKEGEFINNILVKGKIYFPNGRLKIDGTFKDSYLEGPDCTIYHDQPGNPLNMKGTFVKGIISKGKVVSADGKTIKEGTFDEKGILHGENIKFETANFFYYGIMVHGVMTGETTKMLWDGGRYSGKVINGKPDGKGTIIKGMTVFKGTWENGVLQGELRLIRRID